MLKKGFLRKQEYVHISLNRFLKAVVWGIAAALGVYITLCALREGFRMLEFGFPNGPMIFDDAIRNRQNISFAIISTVFGNSIFLGTVFMSPIRGTLRKYKRLTILNDQIFLGGNFLYLFFKLLTMFGIMVTLFFDAHHFIEHMYIFVLFGIVLFLESWKHLLKVYKGRAFKAMAINFLVVILFIFGISRSSIFNYKKIDEVLLAANPKIDLPISSFENVHNLWARDFLKIYWEEGKMQYRLNEEPVAYDELYNKMVENTRGYRPELYYKRLIYILASHDLPVSEVKKIEKVLALAQMYKVLYVTRKPDGQFTSRFDLDGLRYDIDPSDLTDEDYRVKGLPPPPPFPAQFTRDFIKGKRQIDVDIENSIKIEGKEFTNKKGLLQYFKEHINNETYFNLRFEPTISYQNYISALSIFKQAHFELHNSIMTVSREEAQRGWKAQEKYEKEKEDAYKLYPYSLWENFDISTISDE